MKSKKFIKLKFKTKVFQLSIFKEKHFIWNNKIKFYLRIMKLGQVKTQSIYVKWENHLKY
jgi:hypothetical protein